MVDQATAVVLDDVTVRFGATIALDEVDLVLPHGESLALIGPNGSGKTTLLHVLAGLIDPTTGHVELGGLGRVAYLLQRHDHHAWMPLTADEVLRMGRYADLGLWGRLRQRDRDLVDAAAERLHISDLRDRQFSELSGGQRQRVLVAQALVQEPDLLLLDEPVTGLDPPSQERILDLVDELTALGVTVVMSTHHLDEAQRCDRVALIATRLVACGPPHDVLTPQLLTDAFHSRVLRIGAGGDEIAVVDDHGHGH